MSKIEKALGRAREERRNLPVLSADADAKGATGTSLVQERIEHAVSFEAIARMAVSERGLLSVRDLEHCRIIHQERIADPAVQVFRELRTKIVQRGQGQNGVILVTAVRAGSGSSFVAQNLGAAFAFDAGKTALLIDCNLRNPSVNGLIANTSAPGLVDYLENQNLNLDEIIRPVGIARYRAIAAGKRREIPEEYFTSPKMKHLIDALRLRYRERFIILDGPPMSDIADIRILSELCDLVLVVARYGRATTTQIENCLKGISDKKLLGLVFNDEPRIPGRS